MNLKKLETKIQTIIENDEFEFDIENVYTALNLLYGNLIKKVAQFNIIEYEVYSIKEENLDLFDNRKSRSLLKINCNRLENFLEEERENTKQITLDLIEEILVNQDLYDLLVDELPSLEKIITYLNTNNESEYEIVDIIEWFEDWLDCIEPEDISNGLIFTILDNEFNEMYLTDILPNIKK